MKISKHLICLFITSIIILLPIKADAAQIENNKVVPSNKVWKINFNNEIEFDDITKKSIEVLDENSNKISIQLYLENSSKSVLVHPPKEGYKAGKYTLVIKNSIHSKENAKLKKETLMNFSVKQDIVEIKPYKDVTAYQGTNYNLPETVAAVFVDGTIKNVPVKWDYEHIDGSKAGSFIYHGVVEGYDKKTQLNVTIKPMEDTYDLWDYLNKCFGSIDTPAGKIILKHKVLENKFDFDPYDIWIQTSISPYSEVQLVDLQHSIKISSEDKKKTLQILKDLQKTIAKDALRYFPNKKIQGGYFESGYEYEYIHEGYWSLSFFTWKNYNHNEMLDNYRNTYITEFNWFDRHDKCEI